MANKCGLCGKFLSQTDCVKCSKCPSAYHRHCVNVNPDTKISVKWMCMTCKPKASCSGVNLTPRHSPAHAETEVISETFMDARVEGSNEGLLAQEIRLLRTELQTLSREMVNFRQEVGKLNATMSEFNSRLDSVENRVTCLELQAKDEKKVAPASELVETVAQLKRDLNYKDQTALLNDLELTGVPEQNGENPMHLFSLVAQKLGIELDERDVVSVERSGMRRDRVSTATEPPRPRPIIIRLARRAIRDQLLRAARVRRGADTSGFNINAHTVRFYLNERLTYTNKQLFFFFFFFFFFIIGEGANEHAAHLMVSDYRRP
ncbi:unnamed protein product [Parnassius mnemosyne]|uniref:PHD-type domain-containing protein n=1 Tax=Parnassius mnemosyne TaxID=213953 RepID=A0AAV1KFR4_9NEOP